MSELVKATNEGIYINREIALQMELFRTGGPGSVRPMSYREVGEKVGVSHTKWHHLETMREDFIDWGVWAKIYAALAGRGMDGEEPLIDPDDPELMPPVVLLEKRKAGADLKEVGREMTNEAKDAVRLFGMLNKAGRQAALAAVKGVSAVPAFARKPLDIK